MFSYIWRTQTAIDVPAYDGKYEVSHQLPLIWIEHCVECAAPLCYSTCQMFKPRSDGRCVRFEHGVAPYGETGGQICFRRWAKLQALLPQQLDCIPTVRMKKISEKVNRTGYGIERAMKGIKWNRHRPSKVIESIGIKYLNGHHFKGDISSADGFLTTVFNHEQKPLRGMIEIVSDEHPVFKRAVDLAPGWNETFVPMQEIRFDKQRHNTIRFYLDGDNTGTLTFRYLDFVTLKTLPITLSAAPAKKVKCVAWDLDNTLWEGVIGDTKDGKVDIYSQSRNLIESLDKMGVLQTIVSKNTFDVAWKRIEELGIEKYFLYPAINWGRKSQNLLAIAKELNINIDTFALIDDSVFERNEVRTTLPQVRVYDVTEVGSLLDKPEFDIPITEESAHRRESYQKEMKRKEIQASYGGDYDAFLKDCEMHLEIFKPKSDVQRARCLELLQRSNQYNVSKDKRQADTFTTLFTKPEYQLYAFRVCDKWGDYGIVGFVSIESKGTMHYVRDFVMSCRVAQKKVERAFFNWYVNTLPEGDALDIDVWKTGRNSPLREELKGMPFTIIEDNDNHIHFNYVCSNQPFADDGIINIKKLN